VDVTIVDKDGKELVMPTGFDEFNAKADRDYSDCSTEAAENAQLLDIVFNITPEIRNLAGAKGSKLATGGMLTKLNAAEIAMEAGIDMVIANGTRPELLYDIMDGKKVGTKFIGKK
jgi:glutamate 5-kinase